MEVEAKVGCCCCASRLNLKTRGRCRGPSIDFVCVFVTVVDAAVAAATTRTASSKDMIPASRASGPATGVPFTSTRMSPGRRRSRPATGPNILASPSCPVVPVVAAPNFPAVLLFSLGNEVSASALLASAQETTSLSVYSSSCVRISLSEARGARWRKPG